MKRILWACILTSIPAVAAPAYAGLGSRAVRETAEFLIGKFGREASGEGAERLAGRLASAAARHGDDVLAAVRKVGPGAIGVVEGAGAEAPRVLRLLNRHGDDALRLLSRPSGLAMVSRHGDDAAAVLIRHRAVAEPVLEALGEPAIGALGALGPRGGRRLAMMAGELAGGGRDPELLAVIARRGDRAMDFAWEHRGVLAGGVALAAFLSDPEPYLDGTARLAGAGGEAVARIAGAVAEEAVKPVAKAAGGVAAEARTHLARALLVAGLILALAAVLLVRSGLLGWLPVRVGIKVAGKHIVAAMGKGR